MCGIVGYIGGKKATPILLESIKKLEYRGYDSVGMCTIGENLDILKGVGRIHEVHDKINFHSLEGNLGISHTRWATHGSVTDFNAHPHVSNNKKIAVIHNGIVENYQELKKMLEQNGFTFYSETDTETIPNLIEFEMRKGKDFEHAAMDAMKQLEGYYAILAIFEGEGKIVASRNGSPLVIGVGEDENFIASDIPAFLEHTKKVMYIHDNDFIVLDKDGKIRFHNLETGKQVKRPVHSIDWSAEQAEKGNFDHFMMKEISEQVDTVKKAANQDKVCWTLLGQPKRKEAK